MSRKRNAWAAWILALGLAIAGTVAATTWVESTIDCPVCQNEIEVMEVASFGSYIYRWPSRLQMLFWPYTASSAVYFCEHCHAAWFMGDLGELKPEQRAAIQQATKKLREDQPAAGYDEVPVAYRLEQAEAVYGQLGENDFFWSHFHRAAGYQLHVAGDKKGAAVARGKALEFTEKMLAGELDEAQRKELLIVKTSMLYLTGKTAAALKALARAKAVEVSPSTDISAEKAASINEFLGEIVTELEKHISNKEPLPH